MYRGEPTGNARRLLWVTRAYRVHLQPLLSHLKLALGMKQRLTVEEFNELLHLSEAILDYGRMIHAYERVLTPEVIVEIPELARRFRETPQTIKHALWLLSDSGRAEPADLNGCWKLDLAHLSARDDLPAA